jgi:hypothetical protein
VAAFLIGAVIFAILWVTAFTMLASLLIGSGCCVLIVAASSISDIAEMMLDAVASVVFGILAVIGAIFGAIFGLFGF